jgi:hypothetical protein
MAGEETIRDVMAFPKTASGSRPDARLPRRAGPGTDARAAPAGGSERGRTAALRLRDTHTPGWVTWRDAASVASRLSCTPSRGNPMSPNPRTPSRRRRSSRIHLGRDPRRPAAHRVGALRAPPLGAVRPGARWRAADGAGAAAVSPRLDRREAMGTTREGDARRAGVRLARRRPGSGQTLIEIDPESGAQRWRQRPGGPVTGVAVDADTVYASTRGPLFALDRRTGQVRWRSPCSWEPELHPHPEAGLLVVDDPETEAIQAFSAADGARRWEFSAEGAAGGRRVRWRRACSPSPRTRREWRRWTRSRGSALAAGERRRFRSAGRGPRRPPLLHRRHHPRGGRSHG